MKQLLVMTLLAGTLAACGAAPSAMDGAPGGPPQAGRQMARMQAELGLTDAQASQISAIEQSQRNRLDYLRNSSHVRIKALLTPEQAVKFDQMRQQGPRGGMRQDGQWQRPPQMDGRSGMQDRMQQELGLNVTQVSQIQEIQQSERAQMQALQSETHAQIRQVLTAEQAAKFDQTRSRRFGGDRFQRQR
ncbi:MAG: hypothetical protein KJ914_13725 [Gammaproteobacteria bacterium]|nr:hypothetical protein [Gammaproteobacteria bacterium]MBU1723824.1 hypothetical protein [Gammaproteobacteria bacterium]MBU2007017.1 hypothetical protein [Gammaproteobacteria bacterium]